METMNIPAAKMMREEKTTYNTFNGGNHYEEEHKQTLFIKCTEDEEQLREMKRPRLQSSGSESLQPINNSFITSKTTNVRLTRLIKELNLPRISRRFQVYIRLREHPNGGGKILVCNFHKIKRNFLGNDVKTFARQFLRLAFAESGGVPVFCVGVMRNAAEDLRDQFSLMVEECGNMAVKMGSLTNKQEKKAIPLKEYYETVLSKLNSGTFRYGPLLEVSMVGAKGEETGLHFKRMLEELEKSPFLAPLMPWGEFSSLEGTKPTDSNDGPIFWVRPGEQMVSTDSSQRNSEDSIMQHSKKTRTTIKREIEFLDRTFCHRDHVVEHSEFKPTAAVGVLQAIKEPPIEGIPLEKFSAKKRKVVKEVLAFYAGNVEIIASQLSINLENPPSSQCTTWVGESKLNLMQRERGIRYAKLELRENDMYVLPRNVIHQFRTIKACASVAWHARLKHYNSKENPSPSSFDDPEFECDSEESDDKDIDE